MTKTTVPSITALEKRRKVLEAKVIQAQYKKIIRLETQKAKIQVALAKTKLTRTTKNAKIKKLISDQKMQLAVTRQALKSSKTAYKNYLYLQKIRMLSTKIATKPRRQKAVLGAKNKSTKVDKLTPVPACFLGVDTDAPINLSAFCGER